jgi:hypothetical protein
MRKLLWLAFLVVGYIWMVTNGKEELVLAKGRFLYQVITAWFETAEVDFQTSPPKEKGKKRSDKTRRWD